MTDQEQAYFKLTQRVAGVELELAELRKRIDAMQQDAKQQETTDDKGVWYDPK